MIRDLKYYQFSNQVNSPVSLPTLGTPTPNIDNFDEWLNQSFYNTNWINNLLSSVTFDTTTFDLTLTWNDSISSTQVVNLGLDEIIDDRLSITIIDGTGLTWTYDDANNSYTGNVNLGSFSSSDLSEGTNLYFTEERVDDRISTLIQNGTGISWVYDDIAGSLTPSISLNPFSTTNLSEGSNLYFTNERVDDRVSSLLQQGVNITLSYNDALNTLTINGLSNSQISSVVNSEASSINLSGFNNDIGFITQNQNITLTGNITGSGNTVINTNITDRAVTVSKIQLFTPNSVLATDPSGNVTVSSVVDINELSTLNGVTSNIQTTFNNIDTDITNLQNSFGSTGSTSTVDITDNGGGAGSISLNDRWGSVTLTAQAVLNGQYVILSGQAISPSNNGNQFVGRISNPALRPLADIPIIALSFDGTNIIPGGEGGFIEGAINDSGVIRIRRPGNPNGTVRYKIYQMYPLFSIV